MKMVQRICALLLLVCFWPVVSLAEEEISMFAEGVVPGGVGVVPKCLAQARVKED